MNIDTTKGLLRVPGSGPDAAILHQERQKQPGKESQKGRSHCDGRSESGNWPSYVNGDLSDAERVKYTGMERGGKGTVLLKKKRTM